MSTNNQNETRQYLNEMNDMIDALVAKKRAIEAEIATIEASIALIAGDSRIDFTSTVDSDASDGTITKWLIK